MRLKELHSTLYDPGERIRDTLVSKIQVFIRFSKKFKLGKCLPVYAFNSGHIEGKANCYDKDAVLVQLSSYCLISYITVTLSHRTMSCTRQLTVAPVPAVGS